MKRKYINDVFGYWFYYNGVLTGITFGGGLWHNIKGFWIVILVNMLLSYLYLAFFSWDIYLTDNLVIVRRRFFPFYSSYKIKQTDIEKVKMSLET